MATTYPVLLEGGPCAGKTLHLSADQLRSGMTSCGGSVYRYSEQAFGYWVFALASDIGGKVPSGGRPDPRSVMAAFRGLMHTLAFTVPTELHRTRDSINRLRRAVK